jgi:hypothetical protein
MNGLDKAAGQAPAVQDIDEQIQDLVVLHGRKRIPKSPCVTQVFIALMRQKHSEFQEHFEIGIRLMPIHAGYRD